MIYYILRNIFIYMLFVHNSIYHVMCFLFFAAADGCIIDWV